MLKKEDGRIDWSRSAQEIYNRIRGFAPWPGAYTTFRGQTCHLWGEPLTDATSFPPPLAVSHWAPGTLVNAKNDWFVACGNATFLHLQSVKLEGRKLISAPEFANGARLAPAERFGST